MRKRKGIFIIVGILFLCCVVGLSYSKYVESSNKIYLKINFPKSTYKLGEIASLGIEITNKHSEVIYLSGEAIDTMKIKISAGSNNDFKDYYGNSRNFLVDGDYHIKINPNETINRQQAILWNFKPDVSGLNSDAAKPVLEGRISTDYAFSEAGTYFVKAVLILKSEEPIVIESESIKITIEEPVGKDLEVWNKIKNNGNYAYFIQEGDIRISAYKTEERAKFQQEVEEIINQYPNSFYAESLRQSLVKFKSNEAKKQKFLEKIQKEKP